jgi:EmrB/QacA subfamily drug resistance transporter
MLTTSTRHRWVLVAVSGCSLVLAIDAFLLNVALPSLVHDLDASVSELQWIVDSYILVFAGFLLVGGALGDRIGHAKTLEIGAVIFGVGSLIAAFSSSATSLAVWRGVLGFGSALMMPSSVAVLTHTFTNARERGRALGVWTACAGVGLALGPILGGLILSEFWWGALFLVNVPVIAIVLGIAIWVVPESRNPDPPRIDPIGVVLSIAGVSWLVWATIEAPTLGWGSTETIRNYVIAVGLLGAFVVWELRSSHPMVDLHFFRLRRFSAASVTGGIATYTFGGVMFILTQLLQFVFGYTPLAAGFALMPMAVALTFAGVGAPRLVERLGANRGIAVALGTCGIGLVALAAASSNANPGISIAATVVVAGGFGLALAPTTDIAIGAVPRAQAGVASGMISTVRQIGTAMGVAVMGSLLVSGYTAGFTDRLGNVHLSRADAAAARTSLGSALAVARDVGGTSGRVVADAARAAFLDGMRLGILTTAVFLGIGAVIALRFLPRHAHDEVRTGVVATELAGEPVLVDDVVDNPILDIAVDVD